MSSTSIQYSTVEIYPWCQFVGRCGQTLFDTTDILEELANKLTAPHIRRTNSLNQLIFSISEFDLIVRRVSVDEHGMKRVY